MYCLVAKSRLARIVPIGLVCLCFILALAGCGSSGGWQAEAFGTYHIHALAVNTQQAQEIYAGGAQGVVLVSTDAGAHWQRTQSVIPQTATISELSLDASGKKLYAVTNNGVWWSADNGQQWQTVAAGKLPSDTYTALAFDTAAANTLYVGAARHGIFMSTDAGTSWKNISRGLPTSVAVRGLTYDIYQQQLWASTDQGLYRTSNNGTSWSALNQGLPAHIAINSVAPTNSKIVYAGTQQGIYISQDDGAHWSAKNDTLANAQITSLLLNPHSTDTVYVGTQAGAFQSTDQGGTWSAIAAGLPANKSVQALVLAGTNNDHFVAALDTIYTCTNTNSTSILNFSPILIFVIIFIVVFYLSRRGRRRFSRQKSMDTMSP